MENNSFNALIQETIKKNWDQDALTDYQGITLQFHDVARKIEKVHINTIWNLQVPNCEKFPLEAFLNIGFTHHRIILGKVKDLSERLFYIERCAKEHYSVDSLNKSIANDDFHHQGNLPNNFIKSL